MGKVVKNSLGYDSNLYVYQDKSMFNYSIDTILLANFASLNTKTRNVLEVGTNNGALSIFLSERSSKLKIDAIEIQPKALELAVKNIELNNKQEMITPILADFNEFATKHAKEQKEKYDLIICNPPFYKVDSYKKRKGDESVYIATHEVMLTLEDLIIKSAKIIKQKGYLTIVEPTERLVDIFVFMRKHGFEPKKVQFIHPREDKKSNLVLVEGRFKAGWGTHYLNNLYLHTDDLSKHEYKDEVKELYKPLKVIGE
ncbi:MAG: tRNA1(Val) (adenine(37)-N6)-methyltransferase [Mycoplasmataceae bacterium]|nr:tRNA1(Val) (adenine(37)-N6)-methyltransferase [Mycoplasmataceae bacterium]